jgi:hypothetical protein
MPLNRRPINGFILYIAAAVLFCNIKSAAKDLRNNPQVLDNPDSALDKQGKEFYLSIGAVFRDEDDFLAEWIEFHLCLGVEHFFLYNHFSATDQHEEILRPYIVAGLVTLDQAVCDVHCQARNQ